jgi:hypothetical protein
LLLLLFSFERRLYYAGAAVTRGARVVVLSGGGMTGRKFCFFWVGIGRSSTVVPTQGRTG